eukprot:CAMPEP_0184490272 /NCGR_PEP_ID=MMETSP0113_2-20130426/17455_1 /TAXON_ID=91329 /ORGANISM="Norrisiella sphaerica, Strain BC52" /LENGTH=113 /DNA_ID=CAMNT_0026874069 /DNA_START=231 /DNA_END=569 /DNA_ORIENTATION=-
MTGKCGMYGYCEIQTWCPLENKSPESQNLMIGISNFSAFIRTNVQFPLFGITLTSGKDPVPGLSQFYINDMLAGICDGDCFDVLVDGAIILAKARYDCDEDSDVKDCYPSWDF